MAPVRAPALDAADDPRQTATDLALALAEANERLEQSLSWFQQLREEFARQ